MDNCIYDGGTRTKMLNFATPKEMDINICNS